MSNKLSKKQLDLLIERVLSENIVIDEFDPHYEDKIERNGRIYGSSDNDKERIKQDLNPDPDPWDGMEPRKYAKALDRISRLDGEMKNVSYTDVLKGLRSDDNDVKTVAMAIRKGGKFKKKFDAALIQSLISKLIPTDTSQARVVKKDITQLYDTYTNGIKDLDKAEILYIPDRIKTYKHIKDSFEDITGVAPSKSDIDDIFEKRKDPYLIKLYRILSNLEEYNTFLLKHKLDNYDKIQMPEKTALYIALKEDATPFISAKTVKSKLLNKIKKDPNFGEIVKSLSKSLTALTPKESDIAYPTRAVSDPVGRLQTSYSALSPQGSTFNEAGKVLRGKIELDPSFVATIDAIEGDNMLAKITSLANFANNLESELSQMEVGKSSSYLRMLGFLSDAAREYEDSSAGTAFETFLAATGRGIIIGGESGAADVVTLAGRDPVYYSAKLYSSKAIEQSDQADIGFTAVANEAVRKRATTGLIYVIGIKTNLPKNILADVSKITFSKDVKTKQTIGQASRPKAIAMCVLNILPKGDSFTVSALSGDRKYPLQQTVTIKETTSKKAHLNDLVQEVANKNLWHSYIPIFSDVKDAHDKAAKTGSEFIKNSIEKWGSETLKRLTDAFTHLRELDLLTQEHTAKQGKMTALEHSTFIAKVEENHFGFKEDYDAVAADIEPSADSDPQLRIPFEENKKKSKKDLDKLIKEVILKRLLK